MKLSPFKESTVNCVWWFIYMYLKGEFWETDEAPEPGQDGIDKFQHGEESDEVGGDIGHQFNGGRSSGSSCLQEVPLLPKNKTNNGKPTQILKGTDYHILKSIKDHHVQFLTETVYIKLSHLFMPLRK